MGISTVDKPGKVLAEKGVKQIGQISSAEQGVSVLCRLCTFFLEYNSRVTW